MSKDNPKVSILMGIFNCEHTLERAIDSILLQTYTNWELIMCDDGSQDNTYELARKYQHQYPSQMILIKNSINLGLNKTLNNCLERATGEFIARQDADDASFPTRLEKEIHYLLENIECAFVSTGMVVNNGQKRIGERVDIKKRPNKKDFLFSNQFFHAPVMIRKEAILHVRGYTEDKMLLRVEDYNLWTKLYAAGYYGENLQEILYEVYEDDTLYKRRQFRFRLNEAYARVLAVDLLKLPKIYKIYAIQPILKGFMPRAIYKMIHHWKVSR